MQRALGASEPPGLPMIKPQPSPSRVPATTVKQETPVSTSKEDISKPISPKNELVNVATTKETEDPAIGAPTQNVTSIASSLPKEIVPSTVSKTSQNLSEAAPDGQPGIPQQPPLKAVTASPPDQVEKQPPQQPPKAVTSVSKSASPPDQVEKQPPQQPPKAVTHIPKSASPPDEVGKQPPQQPPKAVTPILKSAPPPDEVVKQPPQQPPKAVTSISKSAPQPHKEVKNQPPQQPPKAGKSPVKAAPQPAQPAKQESGGFFGFGGPKTQPTAAQTAGSVTGKMFGFGSSFLSSASTLITSAVQDEPKTTPPTPRKMSTTAHVSPKTTPPASPKALPAKDTKPPALQKTAEKKPEKPQQEVTPSAVHAKVDKAPSELPKAPTDTQSAKTDVSICPLCKVDLNMGSKDPPNYNTCTGCKTTVCNQCGFNPMPHEGEVNLTFLTRFFCFN